MNLEEIRDEVKLLVQDDGFTDEAVDAYINQALLDAVGQLRLPSLKRLDTVETSTSNAYVSVSSLEGGFSGRLVRVYNSSGEDITIVASLELLMSEFGGNLSDVGEVEKCCLEGNVLWYAKIPESAETLTLLYFKDVDVLVNNVDVPGDIPEFCHRPVLVHGAAAMMFDTFEDGIDGVKVNTTAHRYLNERGIFKVREWLGRNNRHYVSSIWSV